MTVLGAIRRARRLGYDMVGFDTRTRSWEAYPRGVPAGDFQGGNFREHRAWFAPASWTAQRIEVEFARWEEEEHYREPALGTF